MAVVAGGEGAGGSKYQRTESQVLREQLVKLQSRLNDTRMKQKRAEAALEELRDRPDGNAYFQIGRMFLVKERGELNATLTSTEEESRNEISKLQLLHDRMSSRLQDSR
eukprot:Lankesteria_metandrocarpae@DN3995_c0_g2_i1.p1